MEVHQPLLWLGPALLIFKAEATFLKPVSRLPCPSTETSPLSKGGQGAGPTPGGA